ncbi:MAG: D-amino acid aminotransferase [Gemmatimonadaceae bacterium]|nr:D-amino acid aminotransferase [Gemmatimonadaceae bacterium]
MTTVYLNGRHLPKEQALIPVEDRGFIFGDGIYEVVRVVEGRIFAWDAHAARMANGLAGLRIDATGADSATLRAACERLIADNGLAGGEATVYLQVSRGAAPRTHHFPPAGTPTTVYAAASPFKVNPALRTQGARAITQPDIRWARCDLKTVNLLGPVLARQAAVEQGAYEALLHRDGMLTEGAATNAFFVLDGVLRTYPLSHYILPGITRQVIMDVLGAIGIGCDERPVPLVDLPRVSEVFVCGTTTDVTPVVAVDGRAVGAGTPGPVTLRIKEAFEQRLYAK